MELRVLVLDDGLDAATRRRFERLVARFPIRCRLTWLAPDPSGIAGLASARWPQTVFLRLIMESLLPEGLDRVLYLDTDLVVRTDLTELWGMPLDGAVIGAIRNQVPSMFGDHVSMGVRTVALDPATPYFNSGVMLIDLPAWRRERISERALAYARAHPDDMPFADQDALNVVLIDRWRELPPDAIETSGPTA